MVYHDLLTSKERRIYKISFIKISTSQERETAGILDGWGPTSKASSTATN